VTKSVVKTTMPVITTHIETSMSYAMNTGHGFQLFETSPIEHKYNSVATSKKDTLDDAPSAKGYSMIAGSKYNFYQVHWHTPSENTIDGLHAAMEAHFVHQLANGGNAKDPYPTNFGYHRLAVIGLLYNLGTISDCNSFLDHFWAYFPQSKGLKEYKGTNPNLNTKLSDELAKGYWHWYGSLTTPPCTEGVSWNLLTSREKVCPAQVETLKNALKLTQNDVAFNNRVAQPLNHLLLH